MGFRRGGGEKRGRGWEKDEVSEKEEEGGRNEERGGVGMEREAILFFFEQVTPIWECCKVENSSIGKGEKQIKEIINYFLADILFVLKFY